MAELSYSRGEDRLDLLRVDLDPKPLLGSWRNADLATKGISHLACELREGDLFVRVTGVGPDGPIDWGEVRADLFTDISITGGGREALGPDGKPLKHYADVSVTGGGPAFWAVYDHGFMRAHLQARFNIGILAVAIWNEFHDDSGRSSYFNREVFVQPVED